MTGSRYSDYATRTTNGALPPSWVDVDLTDALNGEGAPPPTVCTRTDGVSLFYAGKVNAIFGEPECGKGWVIAVAEAQELKAGRHVMHIDMEDGPDGVTSRLRLLGVDDDTIRDGLHYKRPSEALGLGIGALTDQAAYMSFVALDGVTEAMALWGLSADKATDVATFHAALPLPLARAGPPVTTVDHVVKARENRGRWATGSGHKLAIIDGAAYSVEPVTPFARGRSGMSRIRVAKDRSGHWRRNDIAAELQVTAYPDGGVHVDLAESTSVDEDGNFRPTVLMARVSEWLAEHPGPHTTNQVTKNVTGNNEGLRAALAQLEREDYVTVEHNGASVLYEHARTFTDA